MCRLKTERLFVVQDLIGVKGMEYDINKIIGNHQDFYKKSPVGELDLLWSLRKKFLLCKQLTNDTRFKWIRNFWETTSVKLEVNTFNSYDSEPLSNKEWP